MGDLPDDALVLAALKSHWHLVPTALGPVPLTRRLWRIAADGEEFIVRANFPRDPLSAAELVEWVDDMGQRGCAVPRIIPTAAGALSAEAEEWVLSLETVLSGENCSAARLDALEFVGAGLARIHLAAREFAVAPARAIAVGQHVENMLETGRRWREELDYPAPFEEFHAALLRDRREQLDLEVEAMLTHGDVRGPNVLIDGDAVGFVDFNPQFVPAISDLAMVPNKWLMDGSAFERPLHRDEIIRLLQGYQSVRPFGAAERTAFGVLWAAFHAGRLLQDLRIMNLFPEKDRAVWDIEGQIRRLPQLIALAETFIDDLK